MTNKEKTLDELWKAVDDYEKMDESERTFKDAVIALSALMNIIKVEEQEDEDE